jgi:type IV pilus assembly protein PilM
MDDRQHDDYDAEPAHVEDEEPDGSIEPDVIDRLAAYGHALEPETAYEPERSLAPEPEPQPEPTYVPEPEPEPQPEPAFAPELELSFDPVLEPDPFPAVADGQLAEELVVEEAPPAGRRFGRRRDGGSKPRKDSRDKRAKKLVGLKIGASQIAAAQIVNNGSPELVEAFREPLEPGVVVSGEIRDPETLGDALKRFFELHKLPKRAVRLGVSNNRIGVRIFEIDGVADEQQLENAIRFRAEEVLPIPLDEAVLDYVVLGKDVRLDGTQSKRILLVVAYREVVDRYLQACRRAGLHVVGIDLEAFALLRSLEPPTERDASAGALVGVALGHDRTTIAVSTGHYCEFARVLDWGGWSLNVAIARELDRAPSEVEAIKRQLSFAHDTEVDGLTPEQVVKTRNGIQRALASFARELVASLQFYQAQPGALGIGEIVLTGGTAHMDGLTGALGELVGVPMRLGDPFKRLKLGPKVAADAHPGSFAVAIGLGIDD